MTQVLKRLGSEEEGQNLSEYGLLLLLVALLAVAGMRGLASKVDHAYGKASVQVITSGGNMGSITTGSINDPYANQINQDAVTGQEEAVTSGNVVGGLKYQVKNSSR